MRQTREEAGRQGRLQATRRKLKQWRRCYQARASGEADKRASKRGKGALELAAGVVACFLSCDMLPLVPATFELLVVVACASAAYGCVPCVWCAAMVVR